MDEPLLIVMRHAKAHLTSPAGDDATRALTPGGSADALAIGHWLHAGYPAIAQILSSTALRTRQTVAALTVPWGEHPPPTRWDPALYLADLPTLLGIAEAQRQGTMLLVGHNPGLEDLVSYLVGDLGRRVAQAKLMPTSAVYVLQLPERRGRHGPGHAVLRAHMRPKLLPGAGELLV